MHTVHFDHINPTPFPNSSQIHLYSPTHPNFMFPFAYIFITHRVHVVLPTYIYEKPPTRAWSTYQDHILKGNWLFFPKKPSTVQSSLCSSGLCRGLQLLWDHESEIPSCPDVASQQSSVSSHVSSPLLWCSLSLGGRVCDIDVLFVAECSAASHIT